MASASGMNFKARHRRPVAERFHDRYEKSEGGCWQWLASGTSEGYGRIESGGRKILAHRLSFVLHKGEIPEGMLVLHRCDNPGCVNPDHLFLGSNADNSDDKVRKNRQSKGSAHGSWSRGENHYRTQLTDEDIRRIRADSRPHKAIGAEYGISFSHVSDIKRRVKWKHVN